jgi:hypothetical protein
MDNTPQIAAKPIETAMNDTDQSWLFKSRFSIGNENAMAHQFGLLAAGRMPLRGNPPT